MFHAKEHFCKNYWVAAFLGYNSLKWPRSAAKEGRKEGKIFLLRILYFPTAIMNIPMRTLIFLEMMIIIYCIGRHHNLKKPSNTFIYWLILSRILCPGHDQEEIRRQLTTSNDYIFDLGGNFLISFLPCHLRSSAKCKKI